MRAAFDDGFGAEARFFRFGRAEGEIAADLRVRRADRPMAGIDETAAAEARIAIDARVGEFDFAFDIGAAKPQRAADADVYRFDGRRMLGRGLFGILEPGDVCAGEF